MLFRALAFTLVYTPCASLQLSVPSIQHTSARRCSARMDLMETLAPLAAFPIMFVAVQKVAELGSDKMGEMGMIDLEEQSRQEEKKAPAPLTSFLPEVPNPFAKKYAPDFFAPPRPLYVRELEVEARSTEEAAS